MSRRELPRGAWVLRIDTRGEWSPEVLSANAATDHVGATVGATTVLFGGLLHNRTELVQLLGEDPGGNDTALIARAYEQWGEDAIERVQGACAIVICDTQQRVVIAARDRLGTYPLFHLADHDRHVLSNSIDALLMEEDVSNALNLPAIVDHLRHVWPFADETYFEAVRRVPPGNALRVDAKQAGLRRYWDPEPAGRFEWVQPDEIEQFDVLFEQAVARCMAPGPAAVFLSGGLDSASVAAVATSTARLRGDREPLALSLVFPGDANEESVQRGVAAALGLEQLLLHWDAAIGPNGLLSDMIALSARAPGPVLNLWMPAYDRLAEMGRERGCATILTGSGGDEWLIVSPLYAADLIRNLHLLHLVRLYNEHRRSHNVRTIRYMRDLAWRYGLRPVAVDATVGVLRRRAPAVLGKIAVRRLERKAPPWLVPDPVLRREMEERELRRRELQWSTIGARKRPDRDYPRIYFAEARTGFEHPLVSMELEELYAQGRRLGLNILMPFWDAELVEFLYRTPPWLLNAGGRSKALVRQSVAKRFPGLGFESQRKVAANGVVRSLVETDGMREWSRLLDAGALGRAGVVDAPALAEQVRDILGKRDARKYYRVWDLLALESFLQTRREGKTV